MPPPTATLALALARRLAGFYAHRPETEWGRRTLAEKADAILDADAILELTERSLLAPLDAAARLEIEAASRTVAAATAIDPARADRRHGGAVAERPHGPPHRRDLRRPRRLLRLLAAARAWSPPTCSPPAPSRSATT